MPKKGELLNSGFETYTVGENIGGGGSGNVYRVQNSQKEDLAIKVLKKGFNSQKLKRFKNEATFCSKQDHPNLIKVLDYGLTGNEEPFYVMPLASSTLRSRIRDGIMPDDVLPLFSQILDGVEAAHIKGVMHRDLKPENILLDGKGIVKIADFGIAHFEEEELHTVVETGPHERLASWEYAAPEQRRPGEAVGFRADIYSLGLILNEMFTGRVAHGANPVTIASVTPDYAYVDEIVNLMIQNSADGRPVSIVAIKNLLIARGNDFVQQQKLDDLRKTVIPASEVSDPLIDDPIRLVDVDYRNHELIFTLSKGPNGDWINQFNHQGNFSAVMGSEPYRFNFLGITAKVSAGESSAQMVVNHFKNYLQQTNELYAHHIRTQVAMAEERKRRELREAIEREERELAVRQRVKSNLIW